MESFVSSLLIIALAEMGDKTQLGDWLSPGDTHFVDFAGSYQPLAGTLIVLLSCYPDRSLLVSPLLRPFDNCEDESCDIRGRNSSFDRYRILCSRTL